jgi:hypothetical protein
LGTFVLTANQPQNVGDGWLRCSLSFTGTGGADAYIGASSAANTRNGTDGGTIYLWGAQLEQSSTVGEYIPTGATINSAPRFDHNPVTGESLGLLVEEQRTNLLVQSEDFLTSWSRTGLLAFGSGSTVNAIAAPNGTITADLITEDTSSSTHRISQAGLTAVSGQNTVSVYAKQGPRSRNFMINANALTNARATFNLRTGAVENVVNGAASIQDVGSGWYRCSVTGTSTGATSSIFLQVVDGTTETYTGDGTSGIYIWGAQLEAGAFPTSYIPTTTATVTRSADVASITGTAFSSWYRQDEGTVFAEAQSLRSGGRIMMFDDGTTNNRWELRVTSSIPTLNSWSNNVQDGSASSGVNIGDPSTAFKSVGSIALNNAAISTNGATVGLDSSLALPIAINRFFIGSFQGTGTYANGTIRRLTYWPQRLPNSTLQEITR